MSGPTKKQNINLIESCIRHGITHIGENRVQEAESKLEPLKHKNIGFTKRMIGHLQSNKINKALTLFNTIDSIDSISLGKKIALDRGKIGMFSGRSFFVILFIIINYRKIRIVSTLYNFDN